ncbi:protein-tyrosine phosphatase-like protein [Melampsora americana]|nr:protein-tyrosine phosphatase-like protein [Melampsora americana]
MNSTSNHHHSSSSPPTQSNHHSNQTNLIDIQMSDLTQNPSISQSPTISISHSHSPLPIQSTSTSKPNHLLPNPIGPISSFGPRLAFTYFSNPIPDPNKLNAQTNSDTYWFTIDNLLVYLSFFQDTGPLNCACLYRFCLHLHGLLEDSSLEGKRIVMYSSQDPDKRANSALLMALYCVCLSNQTSSTTFEIGTDLSLLFKKPISQPFRDAGYSRADFHLSIQNVLYGVKRAIDLRLLKLDEFDLKEYECFEKVENGDYNWLSPHFIAFASPVEPQGGRIGKSFKMILDQFEKVGVRLVVRLNKKLYDESRFLERGMAHKEMYFDDGTNPTMDMVREFITMCDRIIEDGGVVAVHCKAGLGRTGTLIGAYLIYKYSFTAEEVIGFMRIMRPGTCVGPQQHFLYENQMTWIKWAARDELLSEQESQISPSKTERPITPPPESNNPLLVSTQTPTPTAQTSPSRPLTVPGQPRKTPGAKGRHMVAAPETRNSNQEDERMIDSPKGISKESVVKNLIETEEEEERVDEDCEMSSIGVGPPPPQPKLMSKSPMSKPPPISNPTHPSPVKNPNVNQGSIPSGRGMKLPPKEGLRSRPKPRPASALSCHRTSERNETNGKRNGEDPSGVVMVEGFRRSKAVKDLGTLFEGLAKEKAQEKEKERVSRYNLRGGGGGAGGGMNGSPSKLPMRVMSNQKKRLPIILGSNSHEMRGRLGVNEEEGEGGNGNGKVGGGNGNGKVGGGNGGNGRSVRRRRSSLGVTDVLA